MNLLAFNTFLNILRVKIGKNNKDKYSLFEHNLTITR